jgi:anaerobic magnesium-protoporphyrin IX monomethyl ester cyclase
MNIALVQLPHFYGENESRLPESYPLGLGYVSAYLNEHGVAHEGIDLWRMLLPVEQALDAFDWGGYSILGISAYSTQYRYLREFTLGVKQRWPHVRIMCGGAGPTFSAAPILRNTGIDVCVIGEGEVTALDLIEHIDVPEQVPGVAYLKDGEVVFTEDRPYIRDLDTLPLPNRGLFDMEAYVVQAGKVAGRSGGRRSKARPRRTADIIAGRGCPFACRFCSKTFSGCRLRGLDSIAEEVDMLQRDWGVDHLSFNDELVVTSKRRILGLCERLRGRDITWSCQGRIDQVDRAILEAMKEAGCVDIGYGVESASQSILDAMDKRIDATMIVPVIEMTYEVGIDPVIQYMYGYPGENDETIAATEQLFAAIDRPYIGFTTTPIPGSPLYEEVRAKGLIGDEHDFLMRLDSGYNLQGAMLNLTDMTDDEFVAKKMQLAFRVNHAYYKRRPLLYAMRAPGALWRRAARMVFPN